MLREHLAHAWRRTASSFCITLVSLQTWSLMLHVPGEGRLRLPKTFCFPDCSFRARMPSLCSAMFYYAASWLYLHSQQMAPQLNIQRAPGTSWMYSELRLNESVIMKVALSCLELRNQQILFPPSTGAAAAQTKIPSNKKQCCVNESSVLSFYLSTDGLTGFWCGAALALQLANFRVLNWKFAFSVAIYCHPDPLRQLFTIVSKSEMKNYKNKSVASLTNVKKANVEFVQLGMQIID